MRKGLIYTMSKVIRAQYRAAVKADIEKEELQRLISICQHRAEDEIQKERLLTGGMFQYKNMLFLYMEYITEDETINVYDIPEQWFAVLSPVLESWPEMTGKAHWVYMYPVFWFDQPESVELWRRKERPDAGCGRIAVLYPDKLFSYVCHHQAIVKEGLLVGDRYQMISLHENILFSYFETPRDREQVNIRRCNQESEEIKKWNDVNPNSHFVHFDEANRANFLVIPTLFWVKQEDNL